LGDKGTLDGQLLSIPQSSFQAVNNISLPSVVPYLNLSSSEGITIYVLANNPSSYATNSSKVSISFSGVVNLQNFGSEFVVTLRNVRPINYWAINATTLYVRCFEYSNEPYLQSVTCTNGQIYQVSCPPFAKGVYSTQCPTYHTAPVCTIRPSGSDVDFVESNDCHVVEYDSFSTSCKCSFHGSTSTVHRLLGDSTTLEYSSNMIVTETSFSSSLVYAPALTKVKHNYVVFSTMFITLGVMVIGFVWLLYKDKYVAQSFTIERHSTDRTIAAYFESFFPIDLRSGSWDIVWREFMLSDHPWLKLIASSSLSRELPEGKRGKVTAWVSALGEVLIFLFISSSIAAIFYPDDGRCEALDTKTNCISAKVIGLTVQACSWRSDNESCEFRQPPLRIDILLALIIIISLVFIPLQELLMFLVVGAGPSLNKLMTQDRVVVIKSSAQKDNNHDYIPQTDKRDYDHGKLDYDHGKLDGDSNEVAVIPRRDEFRVARNSKATILRAAKLEKMQQSMDYVSSLEEAKRLHSIRRECGGRCVPMLNYDGSRYIMKSRNASEESLCKDIDNARHRAVILRTEVDLLNSDESKELMLMRHFLVDAFRSPHRHVAYKQFLHPYPVPSSESISWVLLTVIPMYFGVMLFFLVKFNSILGTRSMPLWFLSTFIAVVQDILFVKPMKIWLNSVVINGAVSADIRDVVEKLSSRSRLIVIRTFGVMRDADALVQHFNPACRVARMYPQLPISRLLMSINDFDVTIPEPRKVSIALSLSSISILPSYVFTATQDLICLSFIDVVCFLAYLLGNVMLPVFPALLIILFTSLLLFIISRVLLVITIPDAKIPRSGAYKVHVSESSTSKPPQRSMHNLKDLRTVVMGRSVFSGDELFLSPSIDIDTDESLLKLEEYEAPQLIDPSEKEYDDATMNGTASVPTLHSIRTKPSTSSLAIFHHHISREDIYRGGEGDSKSHEVESNNDDIVEVMERSKYTMLTDKSLENTILHTMLSTRKLASKSKGTDRERKGWKSLDETIIGGEIRRYSRSGRRDHDRKVTPYEHHIASHFVSAYISDDAAENKAGRLLSIDRVSVDSPLRSINCVDDSSVASIYQTSAVQTGSIFSDVFLHGRRKESSTRASDPWSLRSSSAGIESTPVFGVGPTHFAAAGFMPTGMESLPAGLMPTGMESLPAGLMGSVESLPLGIDRLPVELGSTSAEGLMINMKSAVVKSMPPLSFTEERGRSITDAEFDDNLMELMNLFHVDEESIAVQTTSNVSLRSKHNNNTIQLEELWETHSYQSLQMNPTIVDGTAVDSEFENSLKELMIQFQCSDEDVGSRSRSHSHSHSPVNPFQTGNNGYGYHRRSNQNAPVYNNNQMEELDGFPEMPMIDQTWSGPSETKYYSSRHRRRRKDSGVAGPGPGVQASLLHKQTDEDFSFQIQWDPSKLSEVLVIATPSMPAGTHHCGTGPGRSLYISTHSANTDLHKSRFPMFI